MGVCSICEPGRLRVPRGMQLAALCANLVAGWGVRVTCCSRIKFSGAFPYQLLCVAVQFQGPIYTHSENPAPLPPQGMIVQPEMHLPHPGEEPAGHGAAGTDCAWELITLVSCSLCHRGGDPFSLFLHHGRDLLPSYSEAESISILRKEK